jgi:hypothetical protein
MAKIFTMKFKAMTDSNGTWKSITKGIKNKTEGLIDQKGSHAQHSSMKGKTGWPTWVNPK